MKRENQGDSGMHLHHKGEHFLWQTVFSGQQWKLSLQSTPFSSMQHAKFDLEILFGTHVDSEGHLVGIVAFLEHLTESSFKLLNNGSARVASKRTNASD